VVSSAVVVALLDSLELSTHHINGKLEPSQQSLAVFARTSLGSVIGVGSYLLKLGDVREQAGEVLMDRGELAGDLSQRPSELVQLGRSDRGRGRG
jgi:hypothetical protein